MKSALIEKAQMLGKMEDGKITGQHRIRQFSITDSMDMSLSLIWDIMKNRGAWNATDHVVLKNQRGLIYRTIETTTRKISQPSLKTEYILKKEQHKEFPGFQ